MGLMVVAQALRNRHNNAVFPSQSRVFRAWTLHAMPSQ